MAKLDIRPDVGAIGDAESQSSMTAEDSSSITAQDAATVDATYGSEESGVIQNNRTRIAELKTWLDNARTRIKELENAVEAFGLVDSN